MLRLMVVVQGTHVSVEPAAVVAVQIEGGKGRNGVQYKPVGARGVQRVLGGAL